MNARRASGRVEFEERSVLPSRRGLPWWTVTPLAVAVSLTGVAIDSAVSGSIGSVFSVCFFVGCVGAVLVAARRSVFVAGIQPPIIMAALIPLVYIVSGAAGGTGFLSRTQLVGALLPLVTRFPLMGITTLVTVVVALVRTLVLEPRPRADRARRRVPRAGGRKAAERPSYSRGGSRRGSAPLGATAADDDEDRAAQYDASRVDPIPEDDTPADPAPADATTADAAPAATAPADAAPRHRIRKK